jgi:DDHD domain
LARPKLWPAFSCAAARLSRSKMSSPGNTPGASFLGSLESFSPWGSRSATPKALSDQDNRPTTTSPLAAGPQAPGEDAKDQQDDSRDQLKEEKGADHRVSNRYRIPPNDYPEDCPPLLVRWFYATDVIKRRPQALYGIREAEKADAKAATEPKKYTPFSNRDSYSIELAFQKLAEEDERTITRQPSDTDKAIERQRSSEGAGSIGAKLNTSMTGDESAIAESSMRVPVNEDFLFDVDVDARDLGPAYWLGPIYDVRRGSWFYTEGSSTRPCDENLATQLEEGYVKAKPWRNENPLQRSSSRSRSRPSSWMFGDGQTRVPPSTSAGGPDASDDGKLSAQSATDIPPPAKPELQTHRLFGTHMNSVVTYQDSTTAWLLTDDLLSRMTSTVYSRLAGGGHLGGIKLIRGYTEPGKKPSKGESTGSSEETERGRQTPSHGKSQSVPEAPRKELETDGAGSEDEAKNEDEPKKEPESTRTLIEKRISQLSKLSGLGGNRAKEAEAAAEEEAARRKEEEEIRNDYRDGGDVEQDREIEHLVLVAHGIGQRLGLKMESLNFIHDVNVFRKSMKGVYEKSPDLQALNEEVESLPKNCRIQILPVVWRHLLDFPHQSFRENKERDLGNATVFGDEQGFPTMKDITVEGIAPIRNLVEDLFLDILLYQSEYRDRIVHILQRECNRIYGLFCQRNPNFKGKVSLVGHSLGSALFFDLLCHQNLQKQATGPRKLGLWPQRTASKKPKTLQTPNNLELDFAVEDFYAVGSPIGLFQMIKGKGISARHVPDQSLAEEALGGKPASLDTSDLLSTSSPQCTQMYNIFHPTDPVAYRLEPLISSAMKDLKPQPLPYVKKGIFDVPGQGLSGIGMRVGQSVSGLWSSMTTGVASSLLNRSLGIQPEPSKEGRGFQLLNLTGYSSSSADRSKAQDNEDEAQPTDVLEHPPTLIDAKIETLYSGFQRQRRTAHTAEEGSSRDIGPESTAWMEAEERAKQLRREEAKVRALNGNGRVDYSIQE